MDPLHWVFVITAITLMFIVFAASPLQAAIADAMENDAKLQSQRLASIISIMATAPAGASYTFDLPNAKCTATITNSFAKITVIPVAGDPISYASSFVVAGSVRGGEFACKRPIKIAKTSTGIEVS